MNSIVMDTSNHYLVVALYQDDRCLDFIQEEGNRRQSEYELVKLQELLDRQEMELLDFYEIIITIGPGSYTGERVALTIAKTLVAVSSMKCKVVSSLKAYAGYDKAVSILDARSKKMYVGVYDNGKNVIDETLLPVDQFDTFIKQYPDYKIVGDVSLIGNKKTEVRLYETIYELSKLEDYVSNMDKLVPHYIKEVEARKL